MEENNKEAVENNVGELYFIDAKEFIFQRTEGGFISLRIKEKDQFYERVNFYRAFPISKPDEYISVRDIDKNEIGVIRNMAALSDEQRGIVEEDLKRRYFSPEIIGIHTVKDEYGYVYMDISTSAGERSITVPNGSNNFVRLSEERLILIDIDGNRFSIIDYTKLDDKSVKLLESLV